MADRQLVLSFFDDEAEADAAARTLKDSGLTSGDAMGILVLDGPVDLKIDKVGARSTAAGAGIGACLLVLGPAALGVGIVGGTVGGPFTTRAASSLMLDLEVRPEVLRDDDRAVQVATTVRGRTRSPASQHPLTSSRRSARRLFRRRSS